MEDGAEFTSEADALHALLMRRAHGLADSSEGSAEAAELVAIVDAIETYQESAGRLEKYRVAKASPAGVQFIFSP
jgi:hypothetical protein